MRYDLYLNIIIPLYTIVFTWIPNIWSLHVKLIIYAETIDAIGRLNNNLHIKTLSDSTF